MSKFWGSEVSLSYQDAKVESVVTETSKVSECNDATNAEGRDR